MSAERKIFPSGEEERSIPARKRKLRTGGCHSYKGEKSARKSIISMKKRLTRKALKGGEKKMSRLPQEGREGTSPRKRKERPSPMHPSVRKKKKEDLVVKIRYQRKGPNINSFSRGPGHLTALGRGVRGGCLDKNELVALGLASSVEERPTGKKKGTQFREGIKSLTGRTKISHSD